MFLLILIGVLCLIHAGGAVFASRRTNTIYVSVVVLLLAVYLTDRLIIPLLPEWLLWFLTIGVWMPVFHRAYQKSKGNL
ncbi:hypothetical protein [Alkalicoccus luteus]|uniref:hypothetical protein n=1 Tax=Alkalicoccus luteus TaxID=1237094 RepID=UPI0040344839